MAKRASLYALATGLIFAALIAGGYYLMHHRSEEVCGFCSRHITEQARVVAEIGGHTTKACCLHCAVSEARQKHKPLHLVEVTDYPSGAALKPEQAWFVEGSRVMACDHDISHMNEMKHENQMMFDRCSPSVFAFRSRQAANAFAAENGGAVRDLSELVREIQAND